MDADAKALLLAREKYPGLTAEQSSLAREWVRKHADEYDGILFNVRAGPLLLHMVAMKGSEVTLVHVPLWVGLQAVDFLQAGKHWRKHNTDTTAVNLVAIGYDVGASTHELLRVRYISVEIFPRPADAPHPQG